MILVWLDFLISCGLLGWAGWRVLRRTKANDTPNFWFCTGSIYWLLVVQKLVAFMLGLGLGVVPCVVGLILGLQCMATAVYRDFSPESEFHERRAETGVLQQAEAALALLKQAREFSTDFEANYQEMLAAVEELRSGLAAQEARRQVEAADVPRIIRELKTSIQHVEAEAEVRQLNRS